MTRPLILMALTVVAGGSAAAAFVGTSGTAGPVMTTAPDPASATVLDDALPVVRACFDATTVTSTDATRFTVVDYDSAERVAGTSIRPATAASACVDVVFPDGTGVREDSLLEFAAGAATDGTRLSTPGSAPLQNSVLAARAGGTQAPDLVSAAAAASTPDRVVFTFDEALDPALDPVVKPNADAEHADPAAFGFYDAMGQFVAGTSIAGVSGTQITVGFPTSAAASATRFVTLPGAVRDRRCAAGASLCGTYRDWTESPAGQVGAAPAGVLTLVSATADDSGIDTHWSSAVTPGTAAGVRVYREDGRPIAGSYTVSATTDATVLRVGLPAAGTAEPASEVLIGVDPGVAMAVGPTGPTGPNGYGAAPLRTGAQAPGYTDAPDLLSLQYATDRVTLGFDEAVALPIDAAGIRLLLADGSSQPATAVSADGKAVAVQFSGPVASGVGVAVDPGAVVDATGENAGPRGAAGGAPPPAPSATTTPAPSVTATVTAVATVAPAATATPTVVSVASRQRRVVPALLSSLVRHNRQVSGLLQAAAPCQKGRRIAVSSRGAQLGATRTKRHGGFEVKARKLVATRITVTVKKRVIKRSRVTIVCRRVSGKV